ncbi:hypothetical protein [Novosphingobium sp. FSW06-99]|uniref:hypothetical protein n=1 Tax=Novosphingobium sp. FSW06-99 TaxID=1739113 RepID=UPI00076CFCA3|nr:hypothetical protein [Novosphingobium sp. FSW06-99]KUR79519.1 hypothetical protein AQZ49_04910 [Novosphingobium sp. FSW06-99]
MDAQAGQARFEPTISKWIGPAPSGQAVVGFLGIGTLSLVAAGVQPLVFGALVTEHRLTAAGLGWAMTAEFLALALGVGVASAALPPTGLRARGLLAAVLLLLANVLCMRHAGLLILADRALAGFSAGVLLSIPTVILTRSRNAGRWGAVLLVMQGLAQLLFAAVLPQTLMGRLGANGGFLALAGTACVTMAFCLLVPGRLPPLESVSPENAGSGRLSVPALLSLVVVVLVYAFLFAFFAYIGQIAQQAGANEQAVGAILATAVGCSIAGSLVAVFVAQRLAAFPVLAAAAIANVVAIIGVAQLPGPGLFMALAALWGSFWGFLMPYQLPFTIEIDPSRRAALLVPGAQSFGASTGPLLGSFFVTDTESRGALLAAGFCLAAAFLLAAALTVHRKRRQLNRL